MWCDEKGNIPKYKGDNFSCEELGNKLIIRTFDQEVLSNRVGLCVSDRLLFLTPCVTPPLLVSSWRCSGASSSPRRRRTCRGAWWTTSACSSRSAAAPCAPPSALSYRRLTPTSTPTEAAGPSAPSNRPELPVSLRAAFHTPFFFHSHTHKCFSSTYWLFQQDVHPFFIITSVSYGGGIILIFFPILVCVPYINNYKVWELHSAACWSQSILQPSIFNFYKGPLVVSSRKPRGFNILH